MERTDTEEMVRRILDRWADLDTFASFAGDPATRQAMANAAAQAMQCGKTHPDRPDIRCTDLPHDTGPVYCRNNPLGIEWWVTPDRGVITVHDTLGQITFGARLDRDRYVHLPGAGASQCPFCGYPVTQPLGGDRRRCGYCACEWAFDDCDAALAGSNLPSCPNCGFHRTVPIGEGRWRCHRYNCRHEWHPPDFVVDATIEEAEDALARGEGTALDDVAPEYWIDRIPEDVGEVYTTDGKQWTRRRSLWVNETADSILTESGLLHRYGSVYAHPVAPDRETFDAKADQELLNRFGTKPAWPDTLTLYQQVLANLVEMMTKVADGSQRVADKYHSTSKHINVANYHTLSDGARELREAVAQIQALLNPVGDREEVGDA